MYSVEFAKDRQKFSAAHFTIFADGTVERLHGHNYLMAVSFFNENLQMGLVFPFNDAKRQIQAVCDAWDEFVLLPAHNPWLAIGVVENQVEVRLQTPVVEKFFSFPQEDVLILDCDNISSENLARLFALNLAERLRAIGFPTDAIEVTLCESHGQSVSYAVAVNQTESSVGDE